MMKKICRSPSPPHRSRSCCQPDPRTPRPRAPGCRAWATTPIPAAAPRRARPLPAPSPRPRSTARLTASIPFNNFGAGDVRKTVRMRNINFNGIDTGIIGIRITGGSVIAGGVVIIEDCLIDGMFGGAANGISDERTGGGELYIANTTVRNAGGNGILISPGSAAAPVAGQRINASLDNVSLLNAAVAGIFVSNNGRVMINRSTISGHSQVGVAAAGVLAPIEVNISNTAISHNGIGVGNLGGTITIRLANNDISFNTTAIQGATQSHVNNRLQGNTSVGTAPTAIGATTNPTGLQ